MTNEEAIKRAEEAGISLAFGDFDKDGQIDNMDPAEWLDAMTMD